MNKILNGYPQQADNGSGPAMLGDDIVIVSDKNYFSDICGQYVKSDCILMSVCTGGEALVSVNGRRHLMGDGTMCFKTGGSLSIIESASDDYSCCEIAISSDFVKNLPFDLKSFIPVLITLHKEPFRELSHEHKTDVLSMMRLAESLIRRLDTHKEKSIQGIVYSLLCLICDQVRMQQPMGMGEQDRSSQTDRRYNYMFTFLDLLGKHSAQERGVAFYADKMYLTPKYLSTVIKEISGKSASEWIDEYVMTEAKTILKQPDINVSEVAYHLNFSNISFFGKYFKRHAGMSPSAFQRSYAFQ